MSKSINFLQEWHKTCFNKTGKKDHRIIIETLDNPGWWVEINLKDTQYIDKQFDAIKELEDDDIWIYCVVKDNQFQAASSPQNLNSILNIFCKWIDSSYEEEEEGLISYFQEWYQSYCNGDWEHNKNILIESIGDLEWSVFINLEETALEDEKFDVMKIERTKDDWVYCVVEESKFKATCGLCNLVEVLRIFRDWAEMNRVK